MKLFVLTGLITILGGVNVDGYTRRVPHYHRWGYHHNHWAQKEWSHNLSSPGQPNLIVRPSQYLPDLPPTSPQLPPQSIARPPQFEPNWQLTPPHLPPGLPQFKPHIPGESPQFPPNLPVDRPQFQPGLPGPPQFQPDWPPDFQIHIPAEQPQFPPNLPFRPSQFQPKDPGTVQFNPKMQPGLPNFQPNLPPGPLQFQSNLPPGPLQFQPNLPAEFPQSYAPRPLRPPNYHSNWPQRPPPQTPDWLPPKPQESWNPNAPKPNRPSEWNCGPWSCQPANNGYDGPPPSYPTPINEPTPTSTNPNAESTTVPTEQCVLQCPFTPEYNPVCGTNDVTYTNIGFLQCAQSCGVNVQVKCRKSCDDCNLAKDVPPSTTNRTATIENCKSTCKTSQKYLPVCGTNNVTYDNIDKLLCAKNCGLNVELQYRSACNAIASDAKPIGYKTLASFEQCMKSCPMNININHVCGTNNETYINIDRLNCAKSCGQEVELLCSQPCPICSQPTWNSKTTTEKVVVNTTISIEQCTDFCPRSEKFEYVCGTNNVTYDNYEHLQCSQLCGEHVYMLCDKKCSVCNVQNSTSISNSTTSSSPNSTQTPISNSTQTTNSTVKPPVKTETNSSLETASNTTIDSTSNNGEELPISREYVEECMAQSCPSTSEYDPICGSNNVTYHNPTHIVCAQTCGEIVIGLWFGPCYYDIDASPTSPTSDSTSPTDTPPSTVRIGDDVWGQIFETTASPIRFNRFAFDPR